MEDVAAQHQVDVWPDNVEALNLFIQFSTQWRTGPGGVVGLDYTPLLHRMDRMELSTVRYDELLEDIRACEDAALEQIRKNAK